MSIIAARTPLLQLLATISIVATLFLLTLRWQRTGEAGSAISRFSIYRNRREPHGSAYQNKYSIIVSTYDRFEHLLAFLDHYGNGDLPHLDAIFIAWGLGAIDPPDELRLDAYRVPIHLERATRNSLTERFKVPSGMRTNAALWLDDDIKMDTPAVEFAFKAWQEYGRHDHRITGLTHRQFANEARGKVKYIFHQPSYSMVLTNNAFMDKTMLEWFWAKDDRIKAAIAYVDLYMNCEDILMNFIVSERNGLAPILVDLGKETFIHDSLGISKQPGHVLQRTKCMQRFVEIFGRNPLISTNTAIMRSPIDGKQVVPLPPAFRPKGRPWGKDKSFRHN